MEEISAESRRRIMDAAEELFATKGFERTSFVDIARLSGISRGSIPWHFQNKDGLLLAVNERALNRSLKAAHVTPETPFGDVMRAALASNPKLLFVLMTEAMTTSETVREQYVAYFRRHREDTLAYVKLQDGPPHAAKDKKSLAAVLAAAVIGLQFQAALDPEGVDIDASVKALARLVQTSLGWD